MRAEAPAPDAICTTRVQASQAPWEPGRGWAGAGAGAHQHRQARRLIEVVQVRCQGAATAHHALHDAERFPVRRKPLIILQCLRLVDTLRGAAE